jgi:hypothetical protein
MAAPLMVILVHQVLDVVIFVVVAAAEVLDQLDLLVVVELQAQRGQAMEAMAFQ